MQGTSDDRLKRKYVNVGAAVSASWEKAIRMGEACPGARFNAADHCIRSTIEAISNPSTEFMLDTAAEAIPIQPPVRKTAQASAVAREKCNLPLLFDSKCKAPYAFAVWAQRLAQIDTLSSAESAKTVPAFRMGGPNSPALSTEQMSRAMRAIAEQVITDWEKFDYGMQSLRIGRENAWRKTGARPELLNDMTTHTSMLGRQAYSRAEQEEVLIADRKAESVVVQPVETVVRFEADRSSDRRPVYVRRREDGSLELVKVANSVSELGLVDVHELGECDVDNKSSGADQSDESTQSTGIKRKRESSGGAATVKRKKGHTWNHDLGVHVPEGNRDLTDFFKKKKKKKEKKEKKKQVK